MAGIKLTEADRRRKEENWQLTHDESSGTWWLVDPSNTIREFVDPVVADALMRRDRQGRVLSAPAPDGYDEPSHDGNVLVTGLGIAVGVVVGAAVVVAVRGLL